MHPSNLSSREFGGSKNIAREALFSYLDHVEDEQEECAKVREEQYIADYFAQLDAQLFTDKCPGCSLCSWDLASEEEFSDVYDSFLDNEWLHGS